MIKPFKILDMEEQAKKPFVFAEKAFEIDIEYAKLMEENQRLKSKGGNFRQVQSKKERTKGTPITEVFNKQKNISTQTNFDITLLEVIHLISDEEKGERTEILYKFQITVFLNNGINRIFQEIVRPKQLKNFDWVESATRGLATDCNSRSRKKWFLNIVQSQLEKVVLEKYIYQTPGWKNTEIGKLYVYSGGAIGAENAAIKSESGYDLLLKKEMMGVKETFNMAFGMTGICKDGIASTILFLFFHMSLLTSFFEESGHPINFILGIVGITGSRKTSLVTAMVQLFNRERLKADAEFTSTSCGIEELLSKYPDSIVIIDDYILGENKYEQAQNAKKFQELTRLYGNRIPKSRMNFYNEGKKPYFPIKGCCVLTGEQITGITSSISRLFVINVDRDIVINNRLQIYQDNRWILPTYAYGFIFWCSKNVELIKRIIEERYVKNRYIKKFRHPRYSEVYAAFSVVIDIFLAYAKFNSYMTDIEIDKYREKMNLIVERELDKNGKEIAMREPGTIILLAFDEAMREGSNVVLELIKENVNRRDVIFQDENYFFVQRKLLAQIVSEFISKNNLKCVINNDNTIISMVEVQGVLDIKLDSKGGKERTRKLPIQSGNACRYLWINKKKLQSKLIEINDIY